MDRIKLAESMRQDWDERARNEAFLLHCFAAPGMARGCLLVNERRGLRAARISEVLERYDFSAQGTSVSAELLRRAQALHDLSGRVEWMQGNGSDLGGVPTGCVDFVFSYLALRPLARGSSDSFLHS
jgi:hypothetical protein